MKYFFIIFALSIIVFQGFSQPEKHVQWKLSAELSDTGSYLNLKAEIDENWHLYSQYTEGTMPLYFYVDTLNSFETSGGLIELTTPHKKYEDVFEATTVYFDEEAYFKQKLIIKSTDAFKITGYIEYQVCEEGICIPESHEFELNIIPQNN